MTGRAPMRVLVVEDSAVIRRLLGHIIGADPRLTLAGSVESAEEALRLIPTLRPDVISMDIRLPGMDGLEATRRIMALHPTPIVVIADAVEDASLRISMNALRSGALSVVEKPPGLLSGGYAAAADTIATQLAIMAEVPVIRRRGSVAEESERTETRPFGSGPSAGLAGAGLAGPGLAGAGAMRPTLLAIAASTGGPPALARVLSGLPASFPLPVLLVQHIGTPFIEGFASWLDGLVPMSVALARHDTVLRPGQVLVAPGDRHLALASGGAGEAARVRLDAGPSVSGQRPSATVTFEAVALLAKTGGLGVLLTGMGEDGATGLASIRRAGGYTITEHESTAVVYGMPAAAVRLGGSCASLPLELIAGRVLELASPRLAGARA